LVWLQPFFVCYGRVPVSPRDFARSPVVRITAGIEFVVSSVRMGQRDAKAAKEAKASGRPANPEKEAKKAAAARLRDYYQAQIAAGLDDFFDRPYPMCPWCGARSSAQEFFTVPDMLLRKPGRFRYDSCGRCGHIYLNPPLTPAGADFYDRDFADGMHADAADTLRGGETRRDRARAEVMKPFGVPGAWLDVGSGTGHFCNVARDVWPRAVFDGMDSGDGVYEAARRGWVDFGYHGELPEHVEGVARRYDVISMFHHLEHTADPHLELDAAAKALDT
nr:class I SAM-dependent methyltransferase [Micromonospora sp. DSM 115978]